jgi:hypothetical protein
VFENPYPSATIDSWPMQDPIVASLLWSLALLAVFAPLARAFTGVGPPTTELSSSLTVCHLFTRSGPFGDVKVHALGRRHEPSAVTVRLDVPYARY